MRMRFDERTRTYVEHRTILQVSRGRTGQWAWRYAEQLHAPAAFSLTKTPNFLLCAAS
ncbi:hypothetical protein [Streptomyces sp. NPDC012510]|uniref:hypothetical protein n=1 Tax=Streptomyces sp. NPDC012510 TaxID=3364838 RepID=UPI0036EB0249